MAKRKLATKPKMKARPAVKRTVKAKSKTLTSLKSRGTPQSLKLSIPKNPYKQSEFFNILAEHSGLAKKEAKVLIEVIKAISKVHLTKAGPGQFTIPGFVKMTVVNRPATKARKGRNPFTGEEMTFKAKPARRVVKAKVLKKFRTELE